jgi:hypothetical protein
MTTARRKPELTTSGHASYDGAARRHSVEMGRSHSVDFRYALDIQDELGLRVLQRRSAGVFEASHVGSTKTAGDDDDR